MCHSYCLSTKPVPSSWVCQECEAQESESLADEVESSSEIESSESFSEAESDPDAEYQPVEDNLPIRRSTRKIKRQSTRIKYETSSDESQSLPDDENSDFESIESFVPKVRRRLRKNNGEGRGDLKVNLRRTRRNEARDDSLVIRIPSKRIRSGKE